MKDDAISRQAAIRWVKTECNPYGKPTLDYESGKHVMKHLEQMPSSQPEQQWIPCSERLPEHGGRYLISVLDGTNRRTTVAPYLPRCKAWTMTGRMAYWKVIAWMPLPEPYREEDGEEHDSY